jgi:hypothetical protein
LTERFLSCRSGGRCRADIDARAEAISERPFSRSKNPLIPKFDAFKEPQQYASIHVVFEVLYHAASLATLTTIAFGDCSLQWYARHLSCGPLSVSLSIATLVQVSESRAIMGHVLYAL